MVTLLIAAILAALIGVGLMFGGRLLIIRQMVGSAGQEQEEVNEKIQSTLKECERLASDIDRYASKAQLEFLARQVKQVQDALAGEKSALGAIEQRLDTAQNDVEQKESSQQDVKSAKEEDEAKLDALVAKYEEIKEESLALEKKLAESLKNLDAILQEVELTTGQKAVITELQEALQQASSTLRDLAMEHESVTQRINNLRQQHFDLEEEYTKLVEQQLGE